MTRLPSFLFQCSVLNDKLSSLLLSLNEEVDSQSPSPPTVQLLQQESEQTRILYDVNAKVHISSFFNEKIERKSLSRRCDRERRSCFEQIA